MIKLKKVIVLHTMTFLFLTIMNVSEFISEKKRNSELIYINMNYKLRDIKYDIKPCSIVNLHYIFNYISCNKNFKYPECNLDTLGEIIYHNYTTWGIKFIKVIEDLDRLEGMTCDFISSVDNTIHITDTGLAFIPVYIQNKICCNVIAMIYLDDTVLRAYYPIKGNLINPITRRALNYTKDDENDINDFLSQELGEDTKIQDIKDNLVPKLDCCIEDFTNHFRVI